jgi:WD40 repeat protein
VGDAQSPQAAIAVFPDPDGRTLLATAGIDGTVRVWDPLVGTAVGEPLTGHTGMVLAVAAFAGPDGRTLLATTGQDGTVRVWDPHHHMWSHAHRHRQWRLRPCRCPLPRYPGAGHSGLSRVCVLRHEA